MFKKRFRTQVVIFGAVAGVVPVILLAWFLRKAIAPLAGVPFIEVYTITFMSIFLEALPFNLIGSLLSGILESFVSRETLARLTPKRKISQLALASVVGIAFPVCECGVIPVVRRLLKKGVPLRMVITYLLAAPIVNPVVIVSTSIAFRNTPLAISMPLLRIALGVSIAMIVGALIGRLRGKAVLVDQAVPSQEEDPHAHSPQGFFRKLKAALEHSLLDFLDVSKYLLLGSMVAAGLQTVVPRAALVAVGQTPVIAESVMMGLAILLNLCSEADAFVAASFVQFSFSSRLAFLVLGPMFDLKLLIMYHSVFKRPLIVRLVVALLALVLLTCTLVGLLYAPA